MIDGKESGSHWAVPSLEGTGKKQTEQAVKSKPVIRTPPNDRSDHIYFIILFLERLVVVFRAGAQKSH